MGASLMSAGRESLVQKNISPALTESWTLEMKFVSEIRKRKGARAMSFGEMKGGILCVQGDRLKVPHETLTTVFCNSQCLLFHQFQKKINKFEERIAGNLYMPGNMCHVTLQQLDKLSYN